MTIEATRVVAGTDPHIDQVVLDVVQTLELHQVTPVDTTTVRELVDREWARYRDARVQTFVPVLVRRAVVATFLDGERPPRPGDHSS